MRAKKEIETVKVLHVFPLTQYKSMVVFGSVIINFFLKYENELGSDHYFLFDCKKGFELKELVETKLINPNSDRITYCASRYDLLKKILSSEFEHVYFHQLPSIYTQILLSCCFLWNKKIKYSWFIWGGDLYDDYFLLSLHEEVGVTRAIKAKFKHFLSSLFVNNITSICGVDDDLENFSKIYPNTNPINKISYYPSEFLPKYNSRLGSKRKHRNILISHSATPNNSHFEVLEQLSGLKNDNVRIHAILSYGGDAEYVESVIDKGKAIFGERFVPIVEFMDNVDYEAYISTIDIAVLMPARQAGIYSTMALVSSGVKVYYKSNISPYHWLKDHLGLTIYDALLLENLSDSDFLNLDEPALKKNSDCIRYSFGDDNLLGIFKRTYCES